MHKTVCITQIYFIQNKYEKVISEGKELLASYPDSENNSEVYRIMGNAYYHLGNIHVKGGNAFLHILQKQNLIPGVQLIEGTA